MNMNKELTKEEILAALMAITEIDQAGCPLRKAAQTLAIRTEDVQKISAIAMRSKAAQAAGPTETTLFTLDMVGIHGIMIGWLAARRLAELDELERIRVMTPGTKQPPDCST